jgi:protein ImuA
MDAALPVQLPGPAHAARTALPEGLRQSLWQADQLATATRSGEPSGHPLLDAELPGAGWPPGALTELLLAGPGQGELRLLAPLLARLSAGGRAIVCINPPCRPHGPALAAWGIDLARLLWVHTERAEDAPWAAEQALAAHPGAVLCWTDESAPPRQQHTHHPNHRQRLDAALRRLHLLAQGGDSLLFLLRPAAAAAQSSPATLRLHCSPWPGAPAHLAVHLLKRRGPAQAQPLRLDTRAWLSDTLLQRLDKTRPRHAPPFTAPLTAPLLATPPHASPLAVPASA